MKKIIAVSSFVLLIGAGCSSEKTTKTEEPKTVSVQKEKEKVKELTAKDIFTKATDYFKKAEHVTMTCDLNTKAANISIDTKVKAQSEPNKGNSRTEMNMNGTDFVVFDVGGKIAAEVKDPNSGKFISVPANQLNQMKAYDFKTSKNTIAELEKTLQLTDKMKVEKDGEKYKLSFQLNGQEAKDYLISVNESAKTTFERQQATVDSLHTEYVITKEFKVESIKTNAEMKTGKDTIQITGDTKISYDEKFDPIQLPEGN
ncbi:DUF6612 family protein [Bacillus sp. BP-3]|uniref:DUF6612 family protein n=1 Tax=Bacillus sp. BP-3 TaxID=3022773 RepID=UPI00232D951F|nr:DUF6612 family protein [Bacillus sp. BP-3]MDC2865549.1 hypothetical protein [Bacillus sp. BP-3]